MHFYIIKINETIGVVNAEFLFIRAKAFSSTLSLNQRLFSLILAAIVYFAAESAETLR